MVADVLFARAQMAFSLGFHIIFAVVGIGLPVLMVLAERRYLRTGDAAWKDLAQRWGKGAAILFAVGGVSGTALSFELGLLWPHFMNVAGPVHLLVPELTVHSAAAGEATLRAVAWSLLVGALVLVPSMAYLFAVFRGRDDPMDA